MEKKKKKTKYQPLDISMTVVQSSWADDESATFGAISDLTAIREKLPSAPKAVRNAYDVTQLPAQGPWKAHVSNLPFNVKDEDLMKFLGGESEIEDLNIPTQGGRMRGYAVVTFISREALANAMEKNDDMLMNRRIAISLSNDSENRGGRYGDSAWNRRDDRKPPRDDDDSDWRSMAVQTREDTIGRPERPGPSNGDWNRGPPRRTWQDDDSRSGPRYRSGYGERSDRGERYDDRERDRDGPPRRERDWDRERDRGESAWNRDRDTGDRDRGDRDRGDRDRDRGDRDRDGRDGRDYGRDRRSNAGYERQQQEGPRERPRLHLQPRTKQADTAENGETARPASIFGAAKPVDTAARERQIEDRLERERREATDSTRRRGLDREEMPPPAPVGVEKSDSYSGRARKTSDSSGGKNRNPSLGSTSGGSGSGLPLRQSSSDISPASPPSRGTREGPSDGPGRRQRMAQTSSGPAEDDDVFSQNDMRQRRSSTTSSNAQHDSHHQSATPSQPVQSTLVDAPPPVVNVWQVRRDQMQRRVAEAVAESTAPRSGAAPATNSAASAATPHAATPIASAATPHVASHPPTPAAASAPTAPAEKRPPAAEPAETEEPESSSERTAAPAATEAREEKEEKAAPTPPAHSQPRRSPVVVSVVAAQRAAAEGQPPPPPIRENAWQQSHAAMDAVRRPPSPSRMPQNQPQSYAPDRGYSYSQGHPGHGGDWSDGSRGMPRGGDYRDNSGGYRGGGYRGGRGGSWRGGGGGRGSRGGSGYRGRGRGGGGGYRNYPSNSGEAANAADM